MPRLCSTAYRAIFEPLFILFQPPLGPFACPSLQMGERSRSGPARPSRWAGAAARGRTLPVGVKAREGRLSLLGMPGSDVMALRQSTARGKRRDGAVWSCLFHVFSIWVLSFFLWCYWVFFCLQLVEAFRCDFWKACAEFQGWRESIQVCLHLYSENDTGNLKLCSEFVKCSWIASNRLILLMKRGNTPR